MNNNSKTFSAPAKIWDNELGLGTAIQKRHLSVSPIAYNQQKSGQLRKNRASLSDYLSRRLHKNHASVLNSRDFFIARSFSSTPFEYPMVSGENHSDFRPLSASLSHRMAQKPAANSEVFAQENNAKTSTLVQARALPGRDTTILDYRLTPAETATGIASGKASVQSFADPSPASVNSLNPAILRKEKASDVDNASVSQNLISKESQQTKNLDQGKNDVKEITGVRIHEPLIRVHRSSRPSINNFDRPPTLQRYSFTSLARSIAPENRLNPLKQGNSTQIDRRIDSVNPLRFLEANTQNAPVSLSNLSGNINLTKPDHHAADEERFYVDQPKSPDNLKTLRRKVYLDSGNTRSTDAENFISDKNSADKNSFTSRAFDLTGDSAEKNPSLLPINFTSRSPLTQQKRSLSEKGTDIREAPFFRHQVAVSRNERAARSAYRSILMRDPAATFSHPDSESEAFGTTNINSEKIAHTRSRTPDKSFGFIKPGGSDISSVAGGLIDAHTHHLYPINNPINRKKQAASDIFSTPDRNIAFTSNQRDIVEQKYRYWPASSNIASDNNPIKPLSAVQRQFASLAMNNPGHSNLAWRNSNGQALSILRKSDSDNLSPAVNVWGILSLQSHSSDGQFSHLPDIDSASALIKQKSSILIQKQDRMPSLGSDHANAMNIMMRPGYVFHENMPSIKIPARKADFIVNSNHSESTGSMLNRSLRTLSGGQISRAVMSSSPSTGNQNDLPKPVTVPYLNTQDDASIVQRKENSLANQFLSLPLSTGANLYSKVGKYLSSGVLQRTFAEGRKSLQPQRHVSDMNRLPLAQHFSVQRVETETIKENFHDHNPTYIQREGGAPAHPGTSMTVSTPSLQNNSQTTNAEQNHLSQDDLVDKVWRKIMRKMASEQERMGGCGRWA